MSDNLRVQQRRIGRMLLIHLVIVVIVPPFITTYGSIWNYVIVAIAATVALSLIDRRYGRYLFWSSLFIIYLVKEIIVSNLVLAWIIIQPKLNLNPGIFAVPLTVTTSVEITLLSLAIAATPGTIVVELDQDETGRFVLYIHSINIDDPEQLRASIKQGFERMILQISRGATA